MSSLLVVVRVQDMANQRLSFEKPLWHVEVIENACGDCSTVFRQYSKPPSSAPVCPDMACICSVNHALGDGLRLVRASGVFTRYEDGSEAKLELLSRMSKVIATKHLVSSFQIATKHLSLRKRPIDIGETATPRDPLVPRPRRDGLRRGSHRRQAAP